MKYFAAIALITLIALLSGCASLPTPTPHENAVIKHTDEIDTLRKFLANTSENQTFPMLTHALKESMHNPKKFEFIRAESALRESSHKRPTGTYITYYYLIRIHFRGENAFGALRLSHQDYHLFPTGKIYRIQKK